jgi:hypothetical protein
MSVILERRKACAGPSGSVSATAHANANAIANANANEAGGAARAADRVREWLALTELELQVRAHGAHVVLAAGGSVVARLTALGHDAFGLSFPGPRGRWEMLFIDTLDEVMSDLTSSLETARTG